MAFQNLLNSYKKQGFEIDGRRTTKLAKWAFIVKEREGWFVSGYDGIYLYFVDGDVKLAHMNDFLKRYSKIYDEKNFDDRDQGILVYTGNFNTREFRTLAKNVLSENEYELMKLKKVKSLATKKKTKRIKSKQAKKEEIKEKITIEREAERTVTKEADVSVNSIKRNINKWKNVAPKVTGRGKEKKMTISMTSYLASKFPEITLEQNLGGNRIDAVVGKIGIEAKYRPNQSEINRLYGQVDDYLRYLDHVVVVFYDTNQTMINNFKRKIKTGGYDNQLTIVSA